MLGGMTTRRVRRIYVPLSADEIDRLYQLARQERRDPRAQAAVLITQGLVPSSDAKGAGDSTKERAQ
jgi:hypothetical protein